MSNDDGIEVRIGYHATVAPVTNVVINGVEPCNSEIIGRDGRPLPFRCNLPEHHLGGHAETSDEEQREAEAEVVDLIARLLAAAKDVRGHSPSRGMAHGNCAHCRATVQASAFVRAMMAPDEPEAEEATP